MSDKPAATGSGEPKCGFYWDAPAVTECTYVPTPPASLYEVYHCSEHGSSTEPCACVSTPPSSQPTVTLDRETFDKVTQGLTEISTPPSHRGYETSTQRGRSIASRLLALLRAAEGKK
jgi:hypothetical protein